MKDRMQAEMAKAMRLIRAGQLADATAIIQRTLNSTPASDESMTGPGSASEPIEAEFRVIDDSSPAMETSPRDTMRKAGAQAGPGKERPTTFAPGAQHLPGGMHSAMERVRPVTPKAEPSSVRRSGQFVDGAYTNTAGTRAYKLYIPSGYTGQPLPLVVMLHGCTQTSVDFAIGTRMNALAERKKFLVAYPEQGTSANGSKCWNWFQAADQQRGAGEPSLIAGITQQIMGAYSVDASRIYVAGISAGGAMAAILAATYPDLYAAVGVHSGLAYGAAHDLRSGLTAMKQGAPQQTRQLTKVIPLIVFHGDRDATVAPANADRLRDQWLLAANGGLSTMGSAGSSARGTTKERAQVAGGHAYTRFIHHDARGRVIVESWIIHQAGHAWSGGNPAGSFTDPKGPDASAEMVRFFTEHARRR